MLEQLVAFFQAGICVHLDQYRIQVLVKDEVVTQQLKVILLLHHLTFYRLYGVSYDIYSALLEWFVELALWPILTFWVPGDEIEEGVSWYDVAFLELAVLFSCLLDSVVCQLHE